MDALSRSLAPFFLRRTKGEVLKDLPEKTEQVILCELGKTERKTSKKKKTASVASPLSLK